MKFKKHIKTGVCFPFFYLVDKNNNKFCDSNSYICDVCGDEEVSDSWVKIIKTLKKEGYLDEDYPIMCCWCFNERRTRKIG